MDLSHNSVLNMGGKSEIYQKITYYTDNWDALEVNFTVY